MRSCFTKPWGETRYSDGTPPTRYQYTGQYSYTTEFGLYFYNARWYDPALGRFAQADTLVPEPDDPSASSAQAPQAWDRYAYSYGNPVKYIDPNGHMPATPSSVAIRLMVMMDGQTQMQI